MAELDKPGFFTGTEAGGVMKGYRAGRPDELLRK